MPAKTKKSAPSQANPQRTSTLSPTAPGRESASMAKQTAKSGAVVAIENGHDDSASVLAAAKGSETTEEDQVAAPTVNRKKQKRREKEAARRALEEEHDRDHAAAAQSANGQLPHPKIARGPRKGYFTEEPDYVSPHYPDEGDELDDAYYSGDDGTAYYGNHSAPNGYGHGAYEDTEHVGKKKRKSKKGGSAPGHNHSLAGSNSATLTRNSTSISRSSLPPPTMSNDALRSAHRISHEQIWNTSSQAERENIKQFWLELGEEERRSLVKVEKEAVLRKMKEQQKHSCSCTVCGRKRTAIEEELEVLYDAYYEELEQFANHNGDLTNVPSIMAPPRTYSQVRGPTNTMAGAYPTRGRVHELGEDDEELDDDEVYDDEEPYSDEDDEYPQGPPDFFTFGNSLTVKDGILTVADDLLKNDGKHFIDMMEQLAERRMQREEDFYYPSTVLAHHNLRQGHNHPPVDDDDDDDYDDDDDDYDSQEDDEFETDEMDSMTEEQRMEEGRRMFQIFAARMFEQRVLTAYREKVSREKQQRLIEELDQETRLDAAREAKKAKEAAKKKEKKRQQKAAKDEEKAKKDAEKAAQEAALKEAEEKKLEEQRQRREEQRKKREAEKKAAEEDRLRKELEKQRRAQEERDRQAEAERKQREIKEKEKKKREESRKKDRDEREAKEKEARDQKTKEERERRVKEEHGRKEKETAAKAERDARERTRQEQASKRQAVALPPGLHAPPHISHMQSPHFQVATPIIPPNAPTPNRHRQASQQGQQSHASSPRSQPTNTDTSHSSASPAAVAVPQTPGASNASIKSLGQPPVLHHPQPSAPLSPLNNQARTGQPPFNFTGIAGLGMSGPPMSAPGMPPGMVSQMPQYQGPPMGQQRFGPPQSMPFPPGFGGPRQFPPNQPIPFHTQPPGPSLMSQPPPIPKGPMHGRQLSLSTQEGTGQPAPIARPGPIGRPPSTTPDKMREKRKSMDPQVDSLATQLGSKALLDDSDVPLSSVSDSKPIQPVGAPGSGRTAFSSSFGEPNHDTFGGQNWGTFSPTVSNNGSWGPLVSGPRPGNAWPQPPPNAFGAIGGGLPSLSRAHPPRPIAIRLMLTQACKQLASTTGAASDGFLPVQTVLRQLEHLKPPSEPSVSLDEMLDILDTEGNAQNGGGSFEMKADNMGRGGQVIRFQADATTGGRAGAGDIGSPITGHGQPTALFGGFGQAFGAPGKGF